MRKRIICLLLALTIAVGMFPVVSAAEHGMTDIVGHWAENQINWVLDMGLFSGTSETTFSPQGSMSRAMFVTVLARYAGVDPYDFEDWYLPGYPARNYQRHGCQHLQPGQGHYPGTDGIAAVPLR